MYVEIVTQRCFSKMFYSKRLKPSRYDESQPYCARLKSIATKTALIIMNIVQFYQLLALRLSWKGALHIREYKNKIIKIIEIFLFCNHI